MADQSSVEDRLRALMDKVAKVKDGRAGRDGDGDGILNEKDKAKASGTPILAEHGGFSLVSTGADSDGFGWELTHGGKVVSTGYHDMYANTWYGDLSGKGVYPNDADDVIDQYGRAHADKLVTEAQESGRDIVATFRATESAWKRSKSQKNLAAFLKASEAMDKMIKASHAQQNIGHQMIFDLSQPRKKTDQMDLFAKRNRILNDRLKG